MRLTTSIIAATVAALGLGFATAASAKCTRIGFSVNDYGKDGPTKDAKALLDTYIAKVMTERGIKKYQTGKKDVTCELFLDFGVFDEHTCKASAMVCWGDGTATTTAAVAPAAATTTAAPAAATTAETAAPAADTAAKPAVKAAAKRTPKPKPATAAAQ